MDSPFGMLKEQWLHKMKAAREQKKEFSRDGEECMRFFRGPYSFLYGLKEGVPQSGDFLFAGDASMPRPSVAMTINKVAEAVQIFGPSLYHRNPVRAVGHLATCPCCQLNYSVIRKTQTWRCSTSKCKPWLANSKTLTRLAPRC